MTPTPERPEVQQTVEDMIVRKLALTLHLADESKHPDGGKQCCICGARHPLEMTVPGWGGVFACRPCIAETQP